MYHEPPLHVPPWNQCSGQANARLPNCHLDLTYLTYSSSLRPEHWASTAGFLWTRFFCCPFHFIPWRPDILVFLLHCSSPRRLGFSLSPSTLGVPLKGLASDGGDRFPQGLANPAPFSSLDAESWLVHCLTSSFEMLFGHPPPRGNRSLPLIKTWSLATRSSLVHTAGESWRFNWRS